MGRIEKSHCGPVFRAYEVAPDGGGHYRVIDQHGHEVAGPRLSRWLACVMAARLDAQQQHEVQQEERRLDFGREPGRGARH